MLDMPAQASAANSSGCNAKKLPCDLGDDKQVKVTRCLRWMPMNYSVAILCAHVIVLIRVLNRRQLRDFCQRPRKLQFKPWHRKKPKGSIFKHVLPLRVRNWQPKKPLLTRKHRAMKDMLNI
jgi:hypothetical protein